MRDADTLVQAVRALQTTLQSLGLDLASIGLKTRGEARSRVYTMLEARDLYTRTVVPRVQDPDVVCEILGIEVRESWRGDNGESADYAVDEGSRGPVGEREALETAELPDERRVGGGAPEQGVDEHRGRGHARRAKPAASTPPADPAKQRDRFQARMSAANRRETERERAKRRREEEQTEARALGVRVVDKINIDMRWSEEEHDVLRILYPDYPLMHSKLPHRTLDAIKYQVKRLGLAGERSKAKTWTGPEIKTLRSTYPKLPKAEVIASLPGRDWKQIKGQAWLQRLSRPRRSYASTGITVLDAIRDRAFDLKVSMRDLDVMAETGAYFSDRRWDHAYGVNMNKFAKAVEALSGVLIVEWQDV